MNELEHGDAAARERALDAGQSFIVQAPAGSGKTTVLTQRYLRLLTTVDDPEQVLAITFTRKAAGEMRERVQRALEGDITVQSPADARTLELAAAVRTHAARRNWGIDESLARLRIQTIDAFNGYLANALPVTSQNGFGRGIADEPGDLYALAARESMRLAETDADLKRALEKILRRLDDEWARLEELIAGMLSRRSEWLPNLPQLSGEELVPRIEHSLESMVGEELAAATAALPVGFRELAARMATVAAGNLERKDLLAWRDNTAPLGAGLVDLPRWRAVTWLALTQEGTTRKRFTKSEGIPADDAAAKALSAEWMDLLDAIDDGQLAALRSMSVLPDPRVPDEARGALDALSRLLLIAAGELTRLFGVYGECDHPEIAGAARRALTEDSSPTPLAERLGTRLMHILVDEFQDTSRDQYELLRTLTADWSAGDGRTLFLVGDPMQSIYGFRNAEVGRFATVRAAGLAQVMLEPLELRRNFRSAPALVDWCNQVFARVFPPRDDVRRSAVRHLASVAARAQPDPAPCVYRVDTGDVIAEAETVADAIATLVRERPTETIAVLAGARTHLRAIRKSLATRRVAFVGVNLEPLADVSVVRDLEALARALESPFDRVAWLAVLRAPFVGLALADLTQVAAANLNVPAALLGEIPGVSPDGMERLVRTKGILLAAWNERERETRAHLVERTWYALGGPAACADAVELTHARRFLVALAEEDRKRLRGRPPDLGRLMERLYAVDPADGATVSLMTIHASKGLEFDHVFVVGVGRRGRADEARLLNWLEIPRADGGDHLLMAPIRVRDAEDDADDEINAWLKVLLRERAHAERARQAYVALTRAKRSLHLFVHPKVRESEGVVEFNPDRNSLLSVLWPAIGADLASLPGVGSLEDPTLELPLAQARQRVIRRVILPAPPADIGASGELVPLGAEEEAIEFSWVRQTARRVGTVVHEALERFARFGLPAAKDLPPMRVRLEARLRGLGVAAEEARAGAGRALTALISTLEDERGRWLFDTQHRDAHSELALSGVRGRQILNAVIDRTFVDAAGTRWVVDFKTSPHEGGDLEAFLAAEEVRYAAQLNRYAYLARELGPEPVRAGLYYPLLAAWREVNVSGQ